MNNFKHYLDYYIVYKTHFKLNYTRLEELFLSLKEKPFKQYAKESLVPLIFIGIYQVANYLERELISDLRHFNPIFHLLLNTCSKQLHYPKPQILKMIDLFDIKNSEDFLGNNNLFPAIMEVFYNPYTKFD